MEIKEQSILRKEVSSRGGGIEIDLTHYGYPNGSKMSAYQNYLGGGMLGCIAGDSNISNWREDKRLVELNLTLKRHFADLMCVDYEEMLKRSISAY